MRIPFAIFLLLFATTSRADEHLRRREAQFDDEDFKFKQDHLLLDDAFISRQRVSPSGDFKANGKTFSLKDLQPFNVFSLNATLLEDGSPQALEDGSRRDRLFMSTGSDGETILVTKESGLSDDESDLVKTIDILERDGSETYMEAISDGILATIKKEDRDKKKLERFSMGGTGGDESDIARDESFGDANRRELQQGCSSYKVIEVAIAYDSSFCSRVANGSTTQARSIIEALVGRSSLLYEKICVRVKISHLEGFCSANEDPYRDGIATNDIGCGGGGLLQYFSNYWNRNRRNVNRDSAHLFYGTNFPGGAIGCASLGSLCNSGAYGVNEMSFSGDSQLRSNLFSHELGHNAGAPHVGEIRGNYLMEPSINSASNGFASQTRNNIQNYLNSRGCISTETGDGGGDDGGNNGDGGDGNGDNNGDGNGDNNGDGDSDNSSSFRLESSQYRGSCMSVQGGATNGSPVVLQPCDDTSRAQNWVWDEQTHLISTSLGNNKCLFPSGRANNRSKLILWDCNPRYTYAEWSYYNDRTLRPDNASWKCADVRNSDGVTLQLWNCNGTEDKKWIVRG